MRKSVIAALSLVAALLLSACGPKTTTCVNPLTYTDIPDSDIIRVGDDYYMVSTTMYYCPGAPIMKSRDLVHWRLVNYVYDCLEDDDIYNMRDGGRHAYGSGQWATSLRYENGLYYALFIANDQRKTYVYTTDDIENGKWDRKVIDTPFHDASIFFEDGRAYVVWGNGDIRITELEPDLSAIKEGGVDQVLFSCPRKGYMLRSEGAHIYHIGDYYYVLVIDWPLGSVRTETCWRSKTLLGEYEPKVMLQGAFDGRSDGVAQGPIIDTRKGDWYAVMFQDHGAVGRIPTLQPVSWVDGWPIMGDNTVPVKEFTVNLAESGSDYTWDSDEFDSPTLPLVWQWNHKPMDDCWSLSARPGWMRLTVGQSATCIRDARNSLTQRTVGPKCESSVKLDASGMQPGDFAGICAFQSNSGEIGVLVGEDSSRQVVLRLASPRTESRDVLLASLEGSEVYLKINYDFNTDQARFSYSLDGEQWSDSGEVLQMRFTLDYFTGYRTALFNYGPTTGGYADFDYFRQTKIGE